MEREEEDDGCSSMKDIIHMVRLIPQSARGP